MNTTNLKEAPFNITKEGDGNDFNYNDLGVKYIAQFKQGLINYNFKFPDERLFEDKIEEVYQYKISEYRNNIIVLWPDMFPIIVIRDNRFIVVEDWEYEDKEYINSLLLYNYNNYIFYGDKMAFNLLKLKFPERLDDLVIVCGYNKDKQLVKFVFSRFDFLNKVAVHDLIFGNVNDIYKTENGKYKIREGIFDDIETIIYGGATEDISNVKEGNAYFYVNEIIKDIRENSKDYIDPDRTIAFLYEKQLRVGIISDIESNLDTDPSYWKFLKSKNYYNFERLKKYVEDIYKGKDTVSEEENRYFVEDKDGYTNLRKEATTTSSVIEKVQSGEEINVIEIAGDWYKVKTKNGNIGYIHKSRIKSGNNNHPKTIRLYIRPEFESSFQELTAKGEIKLRHTTPEGWDFVSVGGFAGYTPTEKLLKEKETEQEAEKERKKKYSFVVEDEDDIQPEKKKGFWDGLFG